MQVMLTKNFSVAEFSCKCGCDVQMDSRFMSRLQLLRDSYGKPLSITSGARCLKHNKAVGGVEQSLHLANKEAGLKARAVDIAAPSPREKYVLVRLAMVLGFTGIGIASGFIHLDTRDGDGKVWCY